MFLASFRACNFRNLSSLRLTFSQGICVFLGQNAQGKTNLIEALYLLSNLKSFRTVRPADLINNNLDVAVVEGTSSAINTSSTIRLDLSRGKKNLRVDGVEPQSISQYLRLLPSVLFSCEDIRLSLGDPSVRRNYVDRAVFAADPFHLNRLREYTRLLRHRNALLRTTPQEMDLWEEKLAQAGAAIRVARRAVVLALNPIVCATYAAVSGERQDLNVRWPGGQADQERAAEALQLELRASRSRDAVAGFTSVGPHRDGVAVELGGVEARRHASRGQHRSVALSLKIALLDWTTRMQGEPPLFLLDDPGAELDFQRMGYLGRFLANWPGQVFLTCTESSRIQLPDGLGTMFTVKSGNVTQLGSSDVF